MPLTRHNSLFVRLFNHYFLEGEVKQQCLCLCFRERSPDAAARVPVQAKVVGLDHFDALTNMAVGCW